MPGRFFRPRLPVGYARPIKGFNPLDAGALLQTTPMFARPWSMRAFQSPRCRGASSDEAGNRRKEGEALAFQSPRCRGASSDTDAPPPVRTGGSRFNPLDAGALLQTPTACWPMGVASPFQSPRCRGASSDATVPYADVRQALGFNPLDAGALLQTPLPVQEAPSWQPGFNPLDAGALLQTECNETLERGEVEFQSPRCRGASSDCSFSGPTRWRAASFNPLDAGALLQTRAGNVNQKPEHVLFQSPRCRGASSDHHPQP